MLYPLKFKPVYKENVWGGSLLKEVYGREIPSDHTGESWDIACHSHGMSEVSNGHLAGISLEMLFEKHRDALVGSMAHKYDRFPLLVKIIDAKQRLSLQVHPEDDFAIMNENGELGKNEMWFVLKAKKGAKVTLGLKDGVTREAFAKALEEGTVTECINEIEVEAGDVINIPAGLVHSIEEDIMLAEVEENSDMVYRVYDWGRMGLDGKPRALHIEKALEVIDFEGRLPKEKVQGVVDSRRGSELIHYIYEEDFAVDRIELKSEFKDSTENDHMMIYMCIKGRAEILWDDSSTSLQSGEVVLIPAEVGDYSIVGKGSMIRTYIPTPLTDKKNLLYQP